MKVDFFERQRMIGIGIGYSYVPYDYFWGKKHAGYIIEFHFIKWTMPTELVKADPETGKCVQVFVKPTIAPPADQRGSSHVIRWGNMYISITHEVNLFKNYLKQKDAIYRHRLIVWDQELNIVGLGKAFSFLDARVEFCVGATVHNNDLLVSFGFQDNAAFVLRVPQKVVEDLIMEALSNEN